jgi:uncharacterized membrane protein HdeD (DUF308 family)
MKSTFDSTKATFTGARFSASLYAVDGLASLLLGVSMLAQWPGSSAWAIGALAGTAVLVNGITRIAVSSTVTKELRPAQHAA